MRIKAAVVITVVINNTLRYKRFGDRLFCSLWRIVEDGGFTAELLRPLLAGVGIFTLANKNKFKLIFGRDRALCSSVIGYLNRILEGSGESSMTLESQSDLCLFNVWAAIKRDKLIFFICLPSTVQHEF
ncbi:hypothetical protein [Glaciimonas immobilis]|uniref:Uncharacterized protein n=1 Tax=Glaciimonas immobilis TaxID=728004 RepID=A0A840RS67_9BURK|nr:hypothetical protein [Glaciimonas immobilis]KAF3997660.1 hypothetical protein HAV38_13445 [Glaciimonas immobilis]MBB5200625.1 hypothetical protein [Glaciimonas immobilis]